jgi:antirestriction protein
MTNSLIRKEIDAMNHERPNGRNENEHQHSHNPAPASEVTAEFASGDKPRIYVASLADYNAGRLHGAWIDATQDPEQIQADIASMLERSHEPLAEEWAIHDYEGFCGMGLSEYESVERVSRIATCIAEYGGAFASWATICDETQDTIEAFEDAFRGSFPSREAYAEEIAVDLGYDDLIENVIPGHLAPYVRFDADAYAHDIELNGDITIIAASDGGVHVFDANR